MKYHSVLLKIKQRHYKIIFCTRSEFLSSYFMIFLFLIKELITRAKIMFFVFKIGCNLRIENCVIGIGFHVKILTILKKYCQNCIIRNVLPYNPGWCNDGADTQQVLLGGSNSSWTSFNDQRRAHSQSNAVAFSRVVLSITFYFYRFVN